MIVMHFGDKYNWLSMRANCVSSKCRWTTIHFTSMPLIYKMQRCWFPGQAELTKGINVIIDEERPKSCEDKIWSRKVVLEKGADGKDVLKITVKASRLGDMNGGSRSSVRRVTIDLVEMSRKTIRLPINTI
jgi:hypothetical protein